MFLVVVRFPSFSLGQGRQASILLLVWCFHIICRLAGWLQSSSWSGRCSPSSIPAASSTLVIEEGGYAGQLVGLRLEAPEIQEVNMDGEIVGGGRRVEAPETRERDMDGEIVEGGRRVEAPEIQERNMDGERIEFLREVLGEYYLFLQVGIENIRREEISARADLVSMETFGDIILESAGNNDRVNIVRNELSYVVERCIARHVGIVNHLEGMKRQL